MYLVLEYAEHGDLLDYIKARGALSDGRAKDVFRQMISGIGYLH
jgi:serine/threonine protein kinase